MDTRQRLDDPATTLEALGNAVQARIWTALPGTIQSFDAAKLTCTVQPAIKGVNVDADSNALTTVNLPLLVDCPVLFPTGGGCTLTFPLTQGDECLVLFAARCIDAWWQNGGVQPPMTYRMHSLSDGFVLAGARSQPRVLSGVSTGAAQLRSDDGQTYVELDAQGQAVTIVASGGITIKGDVSVTGSVTASGEGRFNAIPVSQHVHPGVQAGGSMTGAPQG